MKTGVEERERERERERESKATQKYRYSGYGGKHFDINNTGS